MSNNSVVARYQQGNNNQVSSSGSGTGESSREGNGGVVSVGSTTYEHPSSGVLIKTQNVVATLDCDCLLDLRSIAMQTRGSEYNPSRFSAVVLRVRRPIKATALIFKSGKIVVTGTKSVKDSENVSKQIISVIKRLGHNEAKVAPQKVQNIVCSCDCKFPIRLEALALSHGKFSSFEPELFPGLIYRMAAPKVVLLIFVSGKVVITGAKEQEDVYNAFNKIYPVLLEHKKQ